MAFNGSGTFNRLYDWTTDEGNGINIEASRMDGEDDGFATGLSTCITKDGQTTITANIPFNSKKITGLTNGSARTDSIALGQVQDNTYEYLGENGGAADAYTWTPSPAISAYAAGQKWIVKIGSGDGNTGASTANISAVGSRNIKKSDGAGSTTALESGDLVAGSFYELVDNGTELVLQNPEKPYLDATNIIKTAGATVQLVKTQTSSVATGTTTMPLDDTIPQNTEGDEYMTLAITPTNSSNILIIEANLLLDNSFAGEISMSVALFQDSTAGALAATAQNAGQNQPINVVLKHTMTAGTASATTFKIRAGNNNAGTTTFNGQSSARRFGGVAASTITITEIKV